MRTSRRTKLRIEKLEHRDVPAQFFVTNTNDAGAGSFRQAIVGATSNLGADIIRFSFPTSATNIQLLSGLPAITDPVDINTVRI